MYIWFLSKAKRKYILSTITVTANVQNIIGCTHKFCFFVHLFETDATLQITRHVANSMSLRAHFCIALSYNT